MTQDANNGGLRKRLDSWISGRAPDDPLYLTNRSKSRKVLVSLFVVLVVVVVAIGVFRGSSMLSERTPFTPASTKALVPSEVASVKDIEVLEVAVTGTTPPVLTGLLRNRTNHPMRNAEAVFAVTDRVGSQLGSVTATVDNLAPGATTSIRIPLSQETAAYALIREVHTR